MQPENRPQILIRKANLTDARRIADLCHLLGYPTSEEKAHERLKSLANNEEHIVYVAYLPNEPVVGWVHIHVLQLVVLERRAVILGLIVNPDYRRCGAGRLLIQHAQQWAKEQGCETIAVPDLVRYIFKATNLGREGSGVPQLLRKRYILVRSNVMRQQAHEFYEKVGYVPLKTQLVLSKDLNVSVQ